MEENRNIPEMRPDFEVIKRADANGMEFWSSRDLCPAMGYSTYYKFERVIQKAIDIASVKGMNVDDHFHLTVEMVRLHQSGIFLPPKKQQKEEDYIKRRGNAIKKSIKRRFLSGQKTRLL